MSTAEIRCQGTCSTSAPALPAVRKEMLWLQQVSCLFPRRRQGSHERKSNRSKHLSVCKVSQEPSYPELEKIAQERETSGSEQSMMVTFREVNTFNLWLWFELYKVPSTTDKDLLETVLESWFVIGRMGGFNGMNMQVSEQAPGEASYFRYNEEETESANQALFMDYSDVETRGKWCRFWVNMGTADELALDILINALSVFSKENLGIKQLIVGGVNADWAVPDRDDQALAGIKDPSAVEP